MGMGMGIGMEMGMGKSPHRDIHTLQTI
jgi:hypothetical protein